MNWYGGGFIPIIIYEGFRQAEEEDFALITEDGLNNIWTELDQDIDIEGFV